MTVSALPRHPRWFVREDVDGLLGLALDNLIQILLIVGLCQGVLGYPSTLVYGRILPAVALSLVVGNVYYSWLAYRLGVGEGRNDRTALPYGINTVSLFAHVFLVMLPVKLMALDHGASAEEAVNLSWQAGLVACLGSGLIELLGSGFADPLRRWLPRAALLSTLAGIGLTRTVRSPTGLTVPVCCGIAIALSIPLAAASESPWVVGFAIFVFGLASGLLSIYFQLLVSAVSTTQDRGSAISFGVPVEKVVRLASFHGW